MDHSTDAAVARACETEHDYDGSLVLRGFRNGFALAGLLWLSIALVAGAEIGLSPSDRAAGPGEQLAARDKANIGGWPASHPSARYEGSSAFDWL